MKRTISLFLILVCLLFGNNISLAKDREHMIDTDIDQLRCRELFSKIGVDIPEGAVFGKYSVFDEQSDDYFTTLCMIVNVPVSEGVEEQEITGLVSQDLSGEDIRLIEADELLTVSSTEITQSKTKLNVTFTAKWLLYNTNGGLYRPKYVGFQNYNENALNITAKHYTCGARYDTSYNSIDEDRSYTITKTVNPAYPGNLYSKTSLSPYLFGFSGMFQAHKIIATIGSSTYDLPLTPFS